MPCVISCGFALDLGLGGGVPCGKFLGMNSDHPPSTHITTTTVEGGNSDAGPGMWGFNKPPSTEVKSLMPQAVEEHDISGEERVPGNRNAPPVLPIGRSWQIHTNVPVHVLDKARTVKASRTRASIDIRKSDEMTSKSYEGLDVGLSY